MTWMDYTWLGTLQSDIVNKEQGLKTSSLLIASSRWKTLAADVQERSRRNQPRFRMPWQWSISPHGTNDSKRLGFTRVVNRSKFLFSSTSRPRTTSSELSIIGTGAGWRLAR